MNDDFNFGLFNKKDYAFLRVCLPTIGVSDTTIGFHTGLNIGSINPIKIINSPMFYAFTWDYPAVEGKFKIQFGSNGKTQLPRIVEILIVDSERAETIILLWDKETLSYNTSNIELAQKLNSDYEADNEMTWCNSMTLLTIGSYLLPSLTLVPSLTLYPKGVK